LSLPDREEGLDMELGVRRFEEPDERREMPLGRFELVKLAGMTVGRARYEPGWKWSEHVGAALGQTSCQVEHIGLVMSGRNRITMDDGRVIEVGPGDLFTVSPGHDSEVIGDEPYVSLHLMGGESYAR
jgi:hypothetical protein